MKYKIAYDCTLKRPGCAILQAALGGDRFIASKFPTEVWLVYPTDDLKLYELDEDQLAIVVNHAWVTKEEMGEADRRVSQDVARLRRES